MLRMLDFLGAARRAFGGGILRQEEGGGVYFLVNVM